MSKSLGCSPRTARSQPCSINGQFINGGFSSLCAGLNWRDRSPGSCGASDVGTALGISPGKGQEKLQKGALVWVFALHGGGAPRYSPSEAVAQSWLLGQRGSSCTRKSRAKKGDYDGK